MSLLLFFLIALIVTVPILGSVRALERYERGLRDTPYEQITLEAHLLQVIPDKDALVMITDESKSIKLYYANRNGWNIPENISLDTFIAFFRSLLAIHPFSHRSGVLPFTILQIGSSLSNCKPTAFGCTTR